MCGEKEMQPAGDLCWGAAVTRRVKEKTSKNCGREAAKNDCPITHYNN